MKARTLGQSTRFLKQVFTIRSPKGRLRKKETPASSAETTETTTSNAFDFSEYEEELLTTGELSEKELRSLS